MTPERYEKLKQTLAKRQPDLTLLTEQIHKPRNIAALIRTADAVGIHEVNIVWPEKQHKSFRGTALGSQQWVGLSMHDNMSSAIKTLQSHGMRVVAATWSERAIDYHNYDYTQPTAVLLGNEKKGVTEEAAQAADEHVFIPMQGMVESFNVSVAAAIILSEAQRQRKEAGLYNRPRLSEQVYRQTLFRWCHPKVADYCDQKQIDYPNIRESDGDIVDGPLWYRQVRVSTSEAE